ncbi:MAG: TadE/TadG family type IV pilus assembly protein [Syntrophomonadaceae bacterium]
MRFTRFFPNEKGQGLVEMALVLPILLLLLFGIVEFGRVYGSALLVSSLARDGARFGAVGHNDAEIENLITSRASWLNPGALSVNISPSYEDRVRGEALAVRVDYSVDLIIPLIADILPNPLPLSSECFMRIEK